MPTTTPELIYDAHASENGIYSETNSRLWCGSNSAVVNSQIAMLFGNVQVKKSQKVTGAPLKLAAINSLNSSSLIVVIGAHKTANAPQPSGNSDVLSRAMTTARVSYTFTGATAKAYTFDLAPIIQEIVNQTNWQPGKDILVQIRPTGGTGGNGGNGGRRLDFYSLEGGNSPTLEITTEEQTVTAQMISGRTSVSRTMMTVSPETPEPPPTIVAQMAGQSISVRRTIMRAARGNPKYNTPFSFEFTRHESHAFVTESGETLTFAAKFDETLGGVQTEMLGSVDEVWYPASGVLTRNPEVLSFTAYLPDRDNPKRDSDRFTRLLPEARQLVLADGRVWELDSAQHTARPTDSSIDLIARTRAAYPQHPVLSGTVQAAFETFGSTPELPIYAIDAAGGITASVLAESWDTGAVAFAVRIAERRRQSIFALGTPIAADGTVPDGSLAVSWDGAALLTHLRGQEFRLREQFIGSFGAVLVGVLRWTKRGATLTTCSALGLRTWELPIGPVQPLSEQTASVGRRADGHGSGAFFAFGSPFLSVRPGTTGEAETVARQLYGDLTAPGLSWEIRPPDVSLVLSRADDKGLELAPGESLTFDLSVSRIGGYTGNLEFAVTADTLTASYALLSQSADADVYRVTLTAPAGTPETAYPVRVSVKAQGADNEGSLLKEVRDSFDAVVQVAAGPAIAPNATALYFANDPVQKRDSQMLMDASGNGNTLIWEGYARPNREFTALMPTGVYGAHVRSTTLLNPAQAHRMGGNATYSFIFGEVNKTRDGTMFHARAENSDNGLELLRSGNGFKLQTTNGASIVTSPDTLTWRGGRARLIVIQNTSDITLLDRDNGASIRLARPAWADDGVRTHIGTKRANNGALSNLCRTYCYVGSFHPLALSDIARRRNMDALQAYAPKSDGLGEFADNAIVIALWESSLGVYRNLAAPALNVQLVPIGTVNTIPGGIATTGSDDSHVYAVTGVPSSEVVTLLTTIQDFAQPKEYTAHVSLNSSTTNAGNATLTRHASRQAFPMLAKPDLSHYFQTVGDKVTQSKASFVLKLSKSGKRLDFTELQTNKSGSLDGTVAWGGDIVFSIGNIKRASGGYADRCATKQLGSVLVRGEFAADALIVNKKLLEA